MKIKEFMAVADKTDAITQRFFEMLEQKAIVKGFKFYKSLDFIALLDWIYKLWK